MSPTQTLLTAASRDRELTKAWLSRCLSQSIKSLIRLQVRMRLTPSPFQILRLHTTWHRRSTLIVNCAASHTSELRRVLQDLMFRAIRLIKTAVKLLVLQRDLYSRTIRHVLRFQRLLTLMRVTMLCTWAALSCLCQTQMKKQLQADGQLATIKAPMKRKRRPLTTTRCAA